MLIDVLYARKDNCRAVSDKSFPKERMKRKAVSESKEERMPKRFADVCEYLRIIYIILPRGSTFPSCPRSTTL